LVGQRAFCVTWVSSASLSLSLSLSLSPQLFNPFTCSNNFKFLEALTMNRYRTPCRQSRKGSSNVEREVCRQFINGSCRYGPSCYYLHEFPAGPSFQVQCRYFQKGGCWFGDRCRYLHVPQAGEGSSGSSRRGSAPAGFPSVLAGHSLADRRGSEPSLLPPQGAHGLNRRGSEPLVTSMSVLQQNFECLTTGIAEEEEFGVVEDGPPQQGAMRPMQQISATDSSSSHNYSSSTFVPGATPAEVQKVTVSEAETQCRVKSSFYIPSKHWVCDGEEKASLIAAFKERSRKLKCTFFMRHGCCPFKSECIYSHDMPPNHTHRRRRSASRDTAEMLEDLGIDGIQLWSYIFALTLLDEDDEDLLDFLDD
ncbi:hypothetical protein cypCar_00022885, partial [Cyprinus carpio]